MAGVGHVTTVLTSDWSALSSPGYPGNYGNNLDCNYTLVGPASDFVVATFEDTFDVEAGVRGCSYDRVAVTERATNTSRGTYCGQQLPEAAVAGRGGLTVRHMTRDTGHVTHDT